MTSPVYSLPLGVLEDIVIYLLDDPVAPLSAVLPLLFTSKYFYTQLGFRTNSHLYARIFRLCFDLSAPIRRLGPINVSGFSTQLRANYDALKRIRRGDIHANGILQTFWTAFSMLMENDGKNRCHLDAAGLHEFIETFIRERLYENSINGWPADNEVNSLALWLLWLTMTKEHLEAQTPERREQMANLILPYVLMSVRYASYIAPHIHYTIPLQQNPPRGPHFITAHGEYPHYRIGIYRAIRLYHINEINLGIPLASIAAKLIYSSRRAASMISIPLHIPRDRTHAFQLGVGIVGPTQEDIRELNEHNVVKFVPKSTWEWSESKESDEPRQERSECAPSARWDDDWNRLADCINIFGPESLERSHYTPGSLCGLWQGWMLCPENGLYEELIETTERPPTLSVRSVRPLFVPVFMRLREYHCMDVEPNQPVPPGDIQNAWFPNRFQEQMTSHYSEYIVGGPDLHDESKCRGCIFRGTSELIFRENDEHYLSMLDDILQSERVEDVEDERDDDTSDDASDTNADAPVDEELVIRRKCDGILDIVLVGETDLRHGQAWHHYTFFGRVRRWDGLVALLRVPMHASDVLPESSIFTGYVVGGQNFVGNRRSTEDAGEPVASEGALVMSKRE